MVAKAPKKGVRSKPKQAGPDKVATVRKLLKKIEAKLLTSQDVKATLGDFIRLLQLQQELEGEQPRDIQVTWVSTSEEDDARE